MNWRKYIFKETEKIIMTEKFDLVYPKKGLHEQVYNKLIQFFTVRNIDKEIIKEKNVIKVIK